MSSRPSVYTNTNGFPLSEGKTLHMDLLKGQLAQRVITVGAIERAMKLAALLDQSTPYTQITSSRGFTTITGLYNNVPVSIVSIGLRIYKVHFSSRKKNVLIFSKMYRHGN